ncbi:MAG: amidohydrolase family protein [Longimicrobiales bacterium]
MKQANARVQRAMLLAAGLAVSAAAPAAAQFNAIPAPAVYAIRNATVINADGTRNAGVNVIVKGSFIESIGANAAIPAGAQVLDGDSLFVYPGIVDAAGAVKYTFPRDSVDRTKMRSWDPPRSVQGFMPSRRVSAYLQPGPTEVADLRKKGVVAVAVMPTDMMMPGQGALLMLRAEPDAQRLVISPSIGTVMSTRGARGVYPTTGMAVPGFYRQTFFDAQRMTQIAQAASVDPRGIVAPAFDADYAVIQQVLAGTMPVYFVASTLEEILTVIRLSDEFKLHPTIVGGAEAWRATNELKTRNIPVLVSLDFPKPRQWKPPAEKSDKPDKPEKKDSANAKPDNAKTDSLKAVAKADSARVDSMPGAQREKKDLENMYANPARLAKAGVRFALTSGGGKADIRDAARKPIEYGLSEADALKAITATPAQILGVAALGRVEAGLPASFTVTTKPMFRKDAKVKYTFVDGVLEKGDTPKPVTDKKPDAGYSANGGAR